MSKPVSTATTPAFLVIAVDTYTESPGPSLQAVLTPP